MRRALFLALLLLLVPVATLPLASASGSDRENATLVGVGTHTGSADEDQGVWYRITVPEGQALHIAYTIVAGHSWNDLTFHDATGAYVGYVSSGNTGAFDPDGADAWIQIETFWSAVDYTFTVSFINVPAQNDAGSGTDAGNSLAGALAIQPGRITGGVKRTAGDVSDWYRLDAPAGTILDVYGAENDFVEIIASDGRRLGEIAHYDSTWTPRTFSMVMEETVYFRVEYASSYAFHVRTTVPTDLLVAAIEIREVPLETAEGDAGVSLTREVLVTLTNAGDGPTRDASVQIETRHTGPTASRSLGRAAVELDAGESITIVVPWDTTGQVGDFEVVALVTNGFDTNAENDELVVGSFVLVGGTPLDVDALHHEIRAGGSSVSTEYGPRLGVQTPAGFLGFQDGAFGLH